MAQQRPATPINLTPPPPQQPTGMSPATRQAVAVVALVLCLIVGIGIIYWFLHGPTHRTMTVDPKAQGMDNTNRQAMRMPPRRPQEAITKNDDTSWTINGHGGVVRVTSNGGSYQFVLYCSARDMQLTPEQVALLSGIVRARHDQAMAKEWGITADQIDQLKQINTGSGAELSSEQQAGLRSLWEDYMKAADAQAKTGEEKKVIARVDELVKTNLDASRKAMAQKLDDAKKIFTPDQIDKITQH